MPGHDLYGVLDDRFRTRGVNGGGRPEVLHDGRRRPEGPLRLPGRRRLVRGGLPDDRVTGPGVPDSGR
ncbi:MULTISPECIES: hypothetical protein [unclassified Streptomyces]|uniref:hypothetical protein n=1 Tax=unclassified Streptomyces TaxID=2593676 RepID=UPI0037032124